MHLAEFDTAQLLMLTFETADSARSAHAELRELRLQGHLRVDASALLTPQASGATTHVVEIDDMECPAGTLLSMLADQLSGKIGDDPRGRVESGQLIAPSGRTALKRIDRGISSARLRRLHSNLLPGTFAVVVLTRASAAMQLAHAVSASRTLGSAKYVWEGLETDLEQLVVDVVGAHVTVNAALLGVALSTPSAEMDS
jgi:hypothetical protein